MDMSQWEIDQSLKDKKVIDSLMYISNNIAKLGNLDIRLKQKHYFILVYVLCRTKLSGRQRKQFAKRIA